MNCYHCNSSDTIRVDSRLTDGGRSRRRRHECLDCGKRFSSLEVSVGDELKRGRRQNDGADMESTWGAVINACLPRISLRTLMEEIYERAEGK